MKRKVMIVILSLIAVILIGCDETKEEEGIKELIFLEKTREYNDSPSLIFESTEDKEYYLIKVDSYLYDNIDFKEEEVLKVKSLPEKGDLFDSIFFNISDGSSLHEPAEKVFIEDEWRMLFATKNYSKCE